MGNTTLKGKGIYYALIGTFILLWLVVAFVSTLHAITFFQLTNAIALSILLGLAFEIGQATVLFSILMTENKNKLLAWTMMIFLTALQVTANVYASFRFMDLSNSNEWTYWQRSILFSVEAESTEMYKVIISWISGALLPLIALGMTSLVAENIKIMKEKKENSQEEKEKISASDLIGEISRVRFNENELNYIEKLMNEKFTNKDNNDINSDVIVEDIVKKKDEQQTDQPMPEDIKDEISQETTLVEEITEDIEEKKIEETTEQVVEETVDPEVYKKTEIVDQQHRVEPTLPPEKLEKIREMAIKKKH